MIPDPQAAPLSAFPLEIVRVFDAAREDVFHAWTDRDAFAGWIGPENVQCDVLAFDARVGSTYRLTMRTPNGSVIEIGGEFRHVEAPSRVAFTWGDAFDASRTTLVTVSLRDLDGKTEMTLRQEGLPDAAMRDAHVAGWQSALNKFARAVSRR